MYNTKQVRIAEDFFIQGDVIGKYIDGLPKGLKPVKGTVVAYGEATGHHHVLETAELFKDNLGNLFAKIDKPVLLLHQEHPAVQLRPGFIQFGERGIMQVEYAGEEERKVRD